MTGGQGKFKRAFSAAKWLVLSAALAAAVVLLMPAPQPKIATAPNGREAEVAARVDMREAMQILNEEHDRVIDQVDRARSASEQKAAEDAQAFEHARLAAAQEAARKLAEQRAAEQRAAEQRAAEMKRVADASVKESRKPKPEPDVVVAGAPLDIVPVTGGESGPLVAEPRGPIETVVAKASAFTGEIKNKAVATVTGIRDWLGAAGDKLLGR